jgi:SAM-dependent methyltransferase
MEEIDFFGSSKPRSANERESLIKRFVPDPVMREDFINYGFNYWDNPEYGVGYGGYIYDGRYAGSADRMIQYYGLREGDEVLEIGCSKGHVLVEFLKRGILVSGIDLSSYAVENAVSEVRPHIVHGSCETLPWKDRSFDFVYSKETMPHLTENQLRVAIPEMMRVCRTENIFLEIQVSNSEHGQNLVKAWDETHVTIHGVDWWRNFLSDLNFVGQVNFKILF